VSSGLFSVTRELSFATMSARPLASDILESITRETVIGLFREQHDVVVEERVIDRTELYVADEMFLCGTGMEITAVQAVDRFEARGYPGAADPGAPGELPRHGARRERPAPRVADCSVLNNTALAPTLLESLIFFVVVALAGDARKVRGVPALPASGLFDLG